MTDINDFGALGKSVSSSQLSLDANYTRSVSVLKRQLQNQLNENANQIWMITDLSNAFLKQQLELEDRIRELNLTEGDEISQELKDKLTEYEKGSRALNENVARVLREFLMTSVEHSTTESLDSRQILNLDVMLLQAQLQEKEQRIKKLEKSKAKLNRFNEQLNKSLQTYKELEKQLKEENSLQNIYNSKVRPEKNMMNYQKSAAMFNKEKDFRSIRSQSEISICSSKYKNDQRRSIKSPVNIDPNIIQVIAKTLIGEYLWKYTRNRFWSRKRHKRFFWIHPYSNILYWSKKNPATYGLDINSKKRVSYFVYIESVREVVNEDYSPSNLYHTSLVITTPDSALEITTQSKEQHEYWFEALKYLHRRSAKARQIPTIPTSLSADLLNNDSDYYCDDDGDSDDVKNFRQCCNGRHDLRKLQRERASTHNRNSFFL
ncbi:meiotic cell cortex C-terminal pleckstrin homology-domain-containing protein [Gigaspora rosea]|uniref:Meiotic cell cortex C-terminal pleckstrin homology-domain-containing protein n=1 Tax=Gigaspora rosea TaxID=44941 RepID=A0A397W4G2_9GLOM|nr:meiotic cell cortex C-terminal pleckstrin homology-domain-containing protein [Gigaspora rosea]